MDIAALVESVKAKRRARGLASVYNGINGPFEMAHPTEAHKQYYDFKYALRAKYATKADVPAADLVELERRQIAAFRASR